jgi:tetratricopeptide (TPR) repeat protein
MAKAEVGRGEEGRRELEALIADDPEFAEARLGKAELDRRAGDRVAAKAGYEEVLRRGGDASPQVEAHLALAAIGGADGRPEVAIDHLRAATQLAPDRDDLREGLARALEEAKRFAEAAEERRVLAELRPNATLNRMLEAYDWVQAGRSDLARERLEQGMKDQPDDRVLANSLARLLSTAREENLRNGPRAVEIARKLYADQPSPDVTETLAMALAESGDFEQAIAVQQGLIAQVRTAGQTGHLPRLEANLRRYEKREPVRM